MSLTLCTARQGIRAITVATVSILAGGCETAPTVNPKPLRELCTNWGGIPLVVPDSRYAPGAIFKISEGSPPAFIDTAEFLGVCKVPVDYLKPIESDPWSQTTTHSVDFKAAAALAYQGIEAGPDYSQVSSIRMEIPQTWVSGLPIGRLNVWYQDNKGIWSQSCRSELERPDYFIVGEAMSVKESKFTAHRANGAKISITGATLGNYFKVEPSVGVTVNNQSEVTIPKASTMCVRQLSFSDGFEVLGEVDKPAVAATSASKALLNYYDTSTGFKQ